MRESYLEVGDVFGHLFDLFLEEHDLSFFDVDFFFEFYVFSLKVRNHRLGLKGLKKAYGFDSALVFINYVHLFVSLSA